MVDECTTAWLVYVMCARRSLDDSGRQVARVSRSGCSDWVTSRLCVGVHLRLNTLRKRSSGRRRTPLARAQLCAGQNERLRPIRPLAHWVEMQLDDS